MARFLITDPAGQNQIFEISAPTVNIGRAETNDLVLDHPSVSRHHSRLTVLPGDTTLINDLGSLNGTLVNGQPIREQRLNDQDKVNIGMYELRYDLAVAEAIHVETGSRAAVDVSRYATAENLSAALRARVEPGPPPAESLPERLRNLERENKLLKLLLGVGKTLSSVMTADVVMQRVMELVFQMDNVERGFVMLHDEKRGFRPAVLLYKDERLRKDARAVAPPSASRC
ncbi:MAG: FHA domain-containing protein [Acidobacteriia bacterium]|nr:FHA domain-containing protein [Terriglobia bacterium]